MENLVGRKDSQYFIDRLGNIIRLPQEKCSYIIDIGSVHYEIANYYYPELKYPDDYVMNLGWVLVGSSVYSVPYSLKVPSSRQVRTLKSLKMADRFFLMGERKLVKYSLN